MTDLTDRMRTCAAYIMGQPRDENAILFEEENMLLNDAAKLLVEAAHEIDVLTGPVDLGEPMTVIEPPPPSFAIDRTPSAMWTGDDLRPIPNVPKNLSACPKCDSRAGKAVRRKGTQIWLVCPVCEHAWAREVSR